MTPARQERVLIVIVTGPIDGEPPHARHPPIAKPTQPDRRPIGDLAVHISEVRPEPQPHPSQIRPVLTGMLDQPRLQRPSCRIRDLHPPNTTTPSPNFRGRPLSLRRDRRSVAQQGDVERPPPVPCHPVCGALSFSVLGHRLLVYASHVVGETRHTGTTRQLVIIAARIGTWAPATPRRRLDGAGAGAPWRSGGLRKALREAVSGNVALRDVTI